MFQGKQNSGVNQLWYKYAKNDMISSRKEIVRKSRAITLVQMWENDVQQSKIRSCQYEIRIHIQNLVQFSQIVLTILSGKEILE